MQDHWRCPAGFEWNFANHINHIIGTGEWTGDSVPWILSSSLYQSCLLKATDKVLLKEVGCTTPFSLDKSNICTQPANAMKAKQIFEQYLYQHSLLENTCPQSCIHIKSQITDVTTFPGIIWPGSRINFPENVQVYESYYTYDGLSMVAEIGGYVGLFLGISVNQVGMLLQKLFLYYQQ